MIPLHTYLPFLLYITFFIVTLLLMGYNKLYQHEIQKSKQQIGITVPERITLLLKVGFYMGCATLLLLSLFIVQTLLVLLF